MKVLKITVKLTESDYELPKMFDTIGNGVVVRAESGIVRVKPIPKFRWKWQRKVWFWWIKLRY